MKNDILLSIVIVTWNTKSQTLDCLKSIFDIKDFKHLNGKIEVIVLDNASSDGTSALIESTFPSVSLIKNEKNIGYAPACNQGMKAALGKFVLLLGSDTILKDNCLTDCLDFLEKHDDCGAVGCKLIYPDGRPQGNCKKFPTIKNGVFTYLSLHQLNANYDMRWFKFDKTIEVDQIATTFLMIQNDILKKIDYFDENYRILYNDVDLCKKIWNTGKKIFFIHTAEVIHHGSFSTKRANPAVRKIMYSDIYRYYKNYFGLAAVILIPILYFRLFIVLLTKTINVTH